MEDANRSPVAGALVVIGNTKYEPKELRGGGQGTDALPFLTFTADDGTFAADGLPVGKTWVTVRARGLGPYRAVRELLAGPAPHDWTIVLPSGVSIEGVVVDEAGAPVRGAYVFSFQDWGNPERRSFLSDAACRFRLDDLPVDQIGSLGATHEVDGVGTLSGSAKAGPPGSIVRIVLHPPLVMRIRLMDEQGRPIADRRVLAEASAFRPGQVRGLTGADGRTTLTVRGQEELELWVTDPEGEGSQPRSRVRGARPGPDEVTLTVREIDRPNARIVGRAVRLDGHLPDGTRAWAVPLVGGTPLSLSLDAASGRFESKRLQAGRYELLLSAHGLGAVSLGRVRVGPRQTLDVGDVPLDAMGSLVVKRPGDVELFRTRKVVRAEGARGVSVAGLPRRSGGSRPQNGCNGNASAVKDHPGAP